MCCRDNVLTSCMKEIRLKEGKAFENGVRGVEGQGRAPEGQARRLQRPV